MASLVQEKEGSVLGATLLISGCCIGAGMLGLPVISAAAGFLPTVVMFVITWLFMMLSGLLLLEVNLWFDEKVSLISMAERTLGTEGKVLTWTLFLFLFYSLMVSFISGAGELTQEWIEAGTGFHISHFFGELLIVAIFGFIVYLRTTVVDQCNRLFMIGLGVTYFSLVAFGAPHVQLEALKPSDWSLSLVLVPIMVISFGYHNLIPTITNYLNRDKAKIQTAIILGSSIPLILYLIWDGLILGILTPETTALLAQGQEEMVTKTLRMISGVSLAASVADGFAFCAIITTFLGVALSLVDFLADGFHVKNRRKMRPLLVAAAVVPPLLCAMVFPRLFITALGYGGLAAIILFGILPALMVWIGRYTKKIATVKAFPFGKTGITLVLLFAVIVILAQVGGLK